MADQETNKEGKFDFDSAGESLGYISLAQARLLAMQTARETPGDYGDRFSDVSMAFEVTASDLDEDYYVVTLGFRPQGDFSGRLGQEQFFIAKEGNVAHRQVLRLPRSGNWWRLPVAITGVIVVIAVVGIGASSIFGSGPFAASPPLTPTTVAGAGGDNVPVAAPLATNTPVPTLTEIPVVGIPSTSTEVPTDTPLPTATATPLPTDTPLPTSTPTPFLATTPPPTNTPLPTYTAFPTATPRPTFTPVPTYTPLPTSTPRPTFSLVPTATPMVIVEPKSSISPSQGPAGTRVTLTGDGFATGQGGLPIRFGTQEVMLASVDSLGSVTTTFSVPLLSVGSYSVTIGSAPPVNFTITSSLSIGTSSGPPGTTVTISGSGFGANAKVSLTFDGNAIRSVSTNNGGSLSTSFQVPEAPGGPHSVGVSEAGRGAMQTTFTVTPRLTLERNGSPPGSSVTVTGTGFSANERAILVTLNQARVASGISADANGSWSASLLIPTLPAGTYTVRAAGSLTPSREVPAIFLTLGSPAG